jgi:hypothetical protein
MALNVFIQSQGGLLFTGGYLIEKRPIIACFDAIFVVSAMLIALCMIALKHARLSAGNEWTTKLPIVGADEKALVHASSNSLRCYQTFFVVAFVLFPAYSLLHFNDKVWNAGVIWSDAPGGFVLAIPVKCTMNGSTEGCDAAKVSKMFASPRDVRFWLAETVHDPKQFQLGRDVPNSSSVIKDSFKPHDLSAECRKDSESCRGVQWFHPWNLLAMWTATAGAAMAVVVLLLELLFRDPRVASEANSAPDHI